MQNQKKLTEINHQKDCQVQVQLKDLLDPIVQDIEKPKPKCPIYL
ncbi:MULTISPECIES: hypothetical protein [Sphingobacterium]|nr:MULTISPECIES: hypothetical protein [unclassified Sphingobacterium]